MTADFIITYHTTCTFLGAAMQFEAFCLQNKKSLLQYEHNLRDLVGLWSRAAGTRFASFRNHSVFSLVFLFSLEPSCQLHSFREMTTAHTYKLRTLVKGCARLQDITLQEISTLLSNLKLLWQMTKLTLHLNVDVFRSQLFIDRWRVQGKKQISHIFDEMELVVSLERV